VGWQVRGSGVFVRALTSDNRWASVAAEDLDDRSFRLFVLHVLASAGLVVSCAPDDMQPEEWRTPKTKDEVEGR
jgi:hypothetical protein